MPRLTMRWKRNHHHLYYNTYYKRHDRKKTNCKNGKTKQQPCVECVHTVLLRNAHSFQIRKHYN